MNAIGFHISAVVAMAAALFAVSTRTPQRALAGFCVALAAVVVPLVQLDAPLVAGLTLLCAGIIAALLAGVLGLRASPQGPAPSAPPWRNVEFWVPAGAGLAGFIWVLLASGSRQVIEPLPAIERRQLGYGEGERALELLAGEQLVASSIVGLLALCCVIAAVVTLVGEGEQHARAGGAD